MAKALWKCDFCYETFDTEVLASQHESVCEYDPAKGMCMTCGASRESVSRDGERYFDCTVKGMDKEQRWPCSEWISK